MLDNVRNSVVRLIGASCVGLCLCGAASAQSLVYEPINPSFGGNPFNSNHLLSIANAQNDYEQDVDEDTSQDALDRFVRSLQSRLLSSLSTQVANAIFGENAQDEGTIIFGDQTVSFVRTLDGIQLTITNADGSSTVITIPTFQVTDDDDDGDDDSGSAKTMLLTADGDMTLRDSFEERVLISLESASGVVPGSPTARSTPELILLRRNDSLASREALSKPSRLARRDVQPIQ